MVPRPRAGGWEQTGMNELPRLLAVTTDTVCRLPDYLAKARAIAGAGPALGVGLVVRAPRATTAEQARMTQATLEVAGAAPVIVHARPDLARAVGAAGVQLRRGDLAPSDARTVFPAGWIGVSVHSEEEAVEAIREGADYLVAGSVFESPTHPDQPGRGLAWLRPICRLDRPVFAIGGITPERVEQVHEAGAWGVAAVSALWSPADPAAAARALLAPWPAGDSVSVTVNGEPTRVRTPLTLADLLGRLELDSRAVVVELNRRIVRRADLAETAVRAGDAVELVHFVGGG